LDIRTCVSIVVCICKTRGVVLVKKTNCKGKGEGGKLVKKGGRPALPLTGTTKKRSGTEKIEMGENNY
jgi:hypothetical protein